MDDDVYFRRLGETRRYAFRHKTCIEASCWKPDVFVDIETGRHRFGCIEREQRGCPSLRDIIYTHELRAKRMKEGWLKA